MKVIRNTPNQLVVANKPWLIGTVLFLAILLFTSAGLKAASVEPLLGIPFGLFAGSLSVVWLVVFVRHVQVIFDRSLGQITIHKRSIYARSKETHPLPQLRRAVLEATISSMGTGNGATLYRPTLDFGDSRHTVFTHYTSTRSPARLVNTINSWLKSDPLDSAQKQA